MNYLAHGRDALGRPFELAGTALPDWLRRLHRRLRFPAARAREIRDGAEDPSLVALAEGVLRNHADDQRFHAAPAFLELTAGLTRDLRGISGERPRFRASVAAHLLVEMLLDATLEERRPGTLERYYADLQQVDAGWLEREVLPRARLLSGEEHPDGLDQLVHRFRASRFLASYHRDERVCALLDAVLRRARVPGLPEQALAWMPRWRDQVRERAEELLD